MNGGRSTRDVEPLLRDWMDDVAPRRAPDRLLEESFARTSATRQARAYPWTARGSRAVLALAVLLALLLALVAAALYAGTRLHVPAPFGLARNGAIAYGAAGDIYVTDPATAMSTAAVAGPTYDFAPFFSPDGTRLAFLRRADPTTDGATDIVVARADGSEVRVITPTPLSEIPWLVRWAPDGRSLAVITSTRADGVLEFLDASGAVAPRVVDPGVKVDGVAFQPPDGRRILFRGQTGDELGLYVMNVDGSGLTALVTPYVSDVPGDTQLYVGGKQPCHWAPPGCEGMGIADLRDPIWSPDGTRIVFRRYTEIDGEVRLHLFVMNTNGSDVEPIGYTAGDVADAYPAWSPDGTRIAFLRYRDGAWGYAVVRLADGAVTTTGPAVLDGLAAMGWSPDGTELLVVEHAGNQRLLILDPDGGPWRALPWTAEPPGWWRRLQVPNGSELGAWQRLPSP